MGERGPVPKRSSQRRRRNKPGDPVDTAAGAVAVGAPAANSKWHPVAKRWFESLKASGQAVFYEPSDWATAQLVAESLSRDLKPQVVGVTMDGKPVRAVVPLRGSSLAAYLKAMSALVVTEGDRRRVRLELERRKTESGEAADVSELAAYRERLQSG
jgi:antitoxin (DNA-binding transcriptional repressor) of toxin-antitoxin stability system